MSGALGAMLFLFIIVDKGGVPPPGGQKAYKAVYLDIDTSRHQLHGILPDSLAKLLTGDSVMVVINAVKPMPSQPQCPECPPCETKPCKTCDDKCPDPDHHRHPICKDPEAHKRLLCGDSKCKACPDPSVHGKTLCDSPGCEKGERTVYVGDPIAFAYKLGFSLTASKEQDEIDIQVCREGGACVYGGNAKGNGMRWLNLKDGLLFGKPRAWNEMIVAEKSFLPGVYTCYARVSCKSASSSSVELVVATKKNNTPTDTEPFKKTITCGNTWIEVGKVQVGADYSITRK